MPAVAGISNNANLLGADNKTAAEVEQWISFADDEILAQAMVLFYITKGFWPFNKNLEEKVWKNLHRSFTTLDTYLKKNTFVVGHRVTLADLTLAANLQWAYVTGIGAEFRGQYANVARYFETVCHQPQVLNVFGGVEFLTENVKFVPPKKEEKPKAAPKAAEKPKAAKKEKEADEEDDTPAPPKAAPHPCASLPPSKFVLDEAKRQYSNLDTPDFLKWFYENFDKEGYSIYRFDYKYNDELTQVFMSSNLIGGFFTRLEASRKYVMGAGAVYGENNDSVIAGAVICRGQNAKDVLGVAPDIESYEVTPIDPFNNADDKAFFESNLAWEGEYKGKKLADAKFLK